MTINKMLLAIDIGNSATKFGVFDSEKLIKRFVIPTIRSKTDDEIFESFSAEIDFRVSAIVISSVVTELNEEFRKLSENHFRQTPFFVDNRFDFGFKINYEPPENAGSDRLIAAFSAIRTYGKPCIICSFGTATTIDAVNSKNEYLGGIIAPGMNTLSEALFIKTSKLPRVEIKKTPQVIENSTVTCIQSGVFYGYLGLVEGLISRIKSELGETPQVIATGGFAPLIAENTKLIETVNENLILEGLRLVQEKLRTEN